MPIYEYRCESCGHVTDALRRMAEADEPCGCEACGSQKTRRAHSVFAAGGSHADTECALPMGPGGGMGAGGCCPCGKPGGGCGGMM